jgi:CoA:oxalate CoA-transferase
VTGPLDGIRVLDLTWALAGPYATMILADLGAEVLKIEIPDRGDFARQNRPFIEDVSAYFLSVNRGKKSLALNLKDPDDRSTFLKLASLSDVVVENFRPGTMERLELGYDVLQTHNPAIIYAACSGFGKNSPIAARGAYDIIIQAMAGTISINGQPDGPPTRVGFSVGDIAGGLYSALAILAALIERTKSGLGQAIEVSLFDAQLAMLENAFARYFATGDVPQRLGSRHPSIATFGVYPTANGHIALAAATESQWQCLCKAIDRPDLIEENRFATNALRSDNHEALNEIIARVLENRTTEQWLERLDKADVPCGPVNDIGQVVVGPQFRSSGMGVTVKHSRLGELKVLGSPMRFSRTPIEISTAAPDLGQHTQEVLSQLIGSDPPQGDGVGPDHQG